MNSRDRIQAAFEHREGDRVPLFEQSVASDVASEILGYEAFTGTTYLHYQEAAAWMQGEAAHDDFVEQLGSDSLELARALHWDMIHPIWRHSARPAAQLDEFNFLYGDPDGDHMIMRFDVDAKTYQVIEQHHTQPPPEEPDELESVVEECERTAAEFRIDDPREAFAWHIEKMTSLGDEFEVAGGVSLFVPREAVWLMACIERPDLVARYLDVQLAMGIESLEAQASVGIRVIWGGGDLAGSGGPLYSPRVFREIVLPRLQTLCARCRELGLWHVFRTDGDVWPIAQELFVESGIDGYGEIDHDAGMDLARLNERYGDRLTFWGNVPCGSLLHRGTADEVRAFTRRMLDAVAPGGGLIAGSSNSIVPGTPAANVMAMVETVLEHGVY